jgi:peptidoglycan/LPS O-acetylase OafA/YrhL
VRWIGVRVPVLLGLLGLSLYLAHVAPTASPVIYGTRVSDAASMWVFFAAGALLRTAQERFPGVFRADVAVLALLGQVATNSLYPSAVPWTSWVFLPYAILAAGLASTPVIRRAARFGDLSYGVYLWAFPIQQVVILAFGTLRMSVNLPLVTALSLAFAWGSWHAIEGPSMRLKDAVLTRMSAPKLTPSTAPVTAKPAA